MISPDDIAGILYEALSRSKPANPDFRKIIQREDEKPIRRGFHLEKVFNPSPASLPAKRLFLSEHEIRKMLRPGQTELSLPDSVIVSPLAEDWLAHSGVRVVKVRPKPGEVR